MNPTIEKMLQHVSVRDFTDQPVTVEEKNALLTAAQHGSSSEYIEAFSIIEITDQNLRNKLADITISSPHVRKADTFYVFIADLHRQATILRAHHQSVDSLKNMESLLVATIDTTIAAQSMALAAESMDLGICYIGSLRNNIKQVAQLLQLPDFTIPLFGMAIGHPQTKNQLKPRMKKNNQVATNSYNETQFTDLTEFDQTVKNYYLQRKTNPATTTLSEKNLGIFKDIRRADVADFLREQGFSLN